MFALFLANIEYNTQYSMLKLQFANYTCLISLPIFLGILSCEAPPKPVPTTRPLQIISTPKNDSPVIAIVERPIQDDEWEDEAKRLRGRLVESYAKYWPLISSEHQHNQLPEVLGDPMEELRTFGVERVGVFLRDGVATEEELQLVVDRLKDVSPKVRRAVATLLAEIQVPGIREHVAQSLELETDSEVVRLELLYFQTNPHKNAIEPTIKRLQQDPNSSAGETLIALLDAIDVDNGTITSILQATNRARKASDSPALITIEAMLGDEKTKSNLIYLLDSDRELMRVAVAKGFAFAGFSEPLLKRANDPAMYTYALSALQNSNNIDSFIDLLELHVIDEPVWNAAIISVATSLDTVALLRADDMLKRKENLEELRLTILKSVWKNASTKSPADRKAIAHRAVPLLIEQNEAVSALQLLNEIENSLQDDDFVALRFAAAINALSWSDAADARPGPQDWIAAYEEMADKNSATAEALKKQIIQRFSDTLTQVQLEQLGIVAEPNTTEQPEQ